MRAAYLDGLATLFYDGSIEIYNVDLHAELEGAKVWWKKLRSSSSDIEWDSLNLSDECKETVRGRQLLEQIVILDGVTVIPEFTFSDCWNLKRVIFANSVTRIERFAFYRCCSLTYIKLSINLEVIGEQVFDTCNLNSVFIPPRCREIGDFAFRSNKNLAIFHVPQDTEIGRFVFYKTKLFAKSPFRNSVESFIDHREEIYNWVKNINNDEEYSLHRIASSYQPTLEEIISIIVEKGLTPLRTENSIGITPFQYMLENPYTDVTEKDIIQSYIRKLLGED